MPVTLSFQSTGAMPSDANPVIMRGGNLTIGRGEENDLCLPDPDRMLSKRHCVLEDHGGDIVVIDISTNGTYLNYGKQALGPTPTPLNAGDILSLGPYELLIDIVADAAAKSGMDIADPLSDGPVSHGSAAAAPSAVDLLDGPSDKGDFLDDLLGGRDVPAGPSGVKRDELGEDGLLPPLGEDDDPWADNSNAGHTQGASTPAHSPSTQDNFSAPRASQGGATIPDDWDDDLLGGNASGDFSDPFAAPAAGSSGGAAFIPEDDPLIDDLLGGAPDQSTRPPPRPVPPSPPVQMQPPAPAPAAAPIPPATSDAARAFLKAAGAGDVHVSDGDLAKTMSNLGNVFRIVVQGVREILMTRTSIKSEFRIEQTVIRASHNNPLKFSISPEQAIEALVRPAKGYLSADQAAEQALNDIKAHEVAMVTGMEAALKGLLARLDPAVLEKKIKTDGGLGNILKSRKAQYWEIYEKMFAEISEQAENDFHEMFSREFARAYQEQLERLK